MNNAEKFKLLFDIYATELWSMSEADFLKWLNEDVPDANACDTISRQQSVDALRKMQTYKLFAGDDMILVDKAQVQTELMMLPSAQPETNCSEIPNNWIPCSERLPEEYGEYLVTKHTIGWNCEEYDVNDIAYFDGDGFHKADRVIAWLPLPEPYQEGEQK